MHTDKEIYLIFRHCPDLLFQLAGKPSPGPCSVSSVEVKALQRTMDCLIVPEDDSATLSVLEIQFQKSSTIYTRTAVEMASIQEMHSMRSVEGIILFAHRKLDPQTPPWSHIIQAVYLQDELEKLEATQPDHPLINVFRPLFEPSDQVLEQNAGVYYRQLQRSPLTESQREALCDVFVSWFADRFSHKTLKEIQMQFVERPDIQNTVLGRELIQIGIAKGLDEGRALGVNEGRALGVDEGRTGGIQQSVLCIMAKKWGSIPPLEAKVCRLGLEEIQNLPSDLFDMSTPEDLEHWLLQASRKKSKK